MEFYETLARRKMVRNFTPEPVDPKSLDRILMASTRTPSAGHSQGRDIVVLVGEETSMYWDACLPDDQRQKFPWPGLLNAPVLAIPCASKQTYLDRYAEPDKGWLDKEESRWPVPYWLVDTAFSSMVILLAAVDEGLGALFFGIFPDQLDAVCRVLSLPEDVLPIGVIAIGHRADVDRASASSARGWRHDSIHRGGW